MFNKETMTIYQIYPKSFNDTTGSGTGDIPGITEKLDYLKDLGIDMVWLSPIYPSPQYDNGYDVSDYTAVNPLYGTMADVDQLIEGAKEREMGIMLDMVLNHCSTEHEWFQKALAGDPYYQDFFYLKPAKADGSLPTNWESKFGGPAWEKFGDTDLYYLHLYAKQQADLNWHNPNVRRELFNVVNFWLERGVTGFRFDVLNVIGKMDFVDSAEPGSSQEKVLYTDTPIVHEWVKELAHETFGCYDNIITVGEMSSTTVENGLQYTQPERDELSMIFSFHHLKVDYAHGDKWSKAPVDFAAFKQIMDHWQVGMSEGRGWNALFLNNHDQPRSNSRFGDVEKYPYETATMLAQTIQLMRGTPYIYQGEEIGMTNPNYTTIDQYRDVETLNYYHILLERGISEKEAMEIIQSKSRDNSRTPFQWDDQPQGGFTTGTPWLAVADNYPSVNAEKELAANGIYRYYQQLAALRKAVPVIAKGDYQSVLLDHPQIMGYWREYEGKKLLVLSNFYAETVALDVPLEWLELDWQRLIGNGAIETIKSTVEFGPYETVAFITED